LNIGFAIDLERDYFQYFFKTYTEKLWGRPCSQISAEWAGQRIKGLSLVSAVKNAFFSGQKQKIKTLLDEFHYPKHGAGMMYDKIAENISHLGGQIYLNSEVISIIHNDYIITSALIKGNGQTKDYLADNFVSSMPITQLIQRLSPKPPENILKAANFLRYRSLLIVYVILAEPEIFPDNWIYVHSPEIKVGRISNFKNWSAHMCLDSNKTNLCMEYFCDEDDDFWNMKDEELINLAKEELEKIKLAKKVDFEGGFIRRVPKAYPVYDGHYKENLEICKKYLAHFNNLQCVGRYGMFRYNNMDHSILSGILAAQNILGEKHNLWQINTEKDYHEENIGNSKEF